MKDSVVAIKPETLLIELPAKPDWFDKELAKVAQRDGRPVYRIVDGQRETHIRCEKEVLKHFLKDENVPMYVPVIHQVFRRKELDGSGKFRYYKTIEAAKKDEGNLDGVEFTSFISKRAVGQPCWIVEVYISPDELGTPADWELTRWADMQIHGVDRKVDVMGPYPREGMYLYCFPVVDDEGNAVAPGTRTIEECKKRWKFATEDTKSLEQAIKDYEDRQKKFEEKQIGQIVDNFYQYHGISARRIDGTAISRPIR